MNQLSSDEIDEPSENEKWYDREIAPKLQSLCLECYQHGMSFISVVEYDPGSQARLYRFTENVGLAMTMTNHCANTAPNIDGFIIGLLRYCREKGIDTSGSFVMQRMSPHD